MPAMTIHPLMGGRSWLGEKKVRPEGGAMTDLGFLGLDGPLPDSFAPLVRSSA